MIAPRARSGHHPIGARRRRSTNALPSAGAAVAALPLREGGRYRLPVWQYDGGKGEFTVNVVGRERVTTPAGPVDAWALDAGSDPASLMRCYVSRRHPIELGYRAGPFEQKPGGTCTASAR